MTGRPPESGEVVTVGELLDELQDEQLVDADRRTAVASAARELAPGPSDDPWYLRGLAGVGAWVAASLVVASLSCSGLVELAGPYPFVWGVLFLAVGVGSYVVGEESEVFPRQLALASALIGEGLLAAGLYEQQGLVWASGLYCGLVAVLYPWFALHSHRFISSLAALSLAAALVGDLGSHAGYAALFVLEVVVLCVSFSEDRFVPVRWKLALRPLGFAAAISVLWLSSEVYLREFVGVSTMWPYTLIAAIPSVYLVGQLAARITGARGPAVGWGAVGTGLLAAISTPAIVTTCAVLLAGASRRAVALLVLGGLSLVYNVGTFYYAVPLNVHAKAAALVGTGVVLLTAAWGLRRSEAPAFPGAER